MLIIGDSSFDAKPENKGKYLEACKTLYKTFLAEITLDKEPKSVYEWRELFFKHRKTIAEKVLTSTQGKVLIDIEETGDTSQDKQRFLASIEPLFIYAPDFLSSGTSYIIEEKLTFQSQIAQKVVSRVMALIGTEPTEENRLAKLGEMYTNAFKTKEMSEDDMNFSAKLIPTVPEGIKRNIFVSFLASQIISREKQQVVANFLIGVNDEPYTKFTESFGNDVEQGFFLSAFNSSGNGLQKLFFILSPKNVKALVEICNTTDITKLAQLFSQESEVFLEKLNTLFIFADTQRLSQMIEQVEPSRLRSFIDEVQNIQIVCHLLKVVDIEKLIVVLNTEDIDSGLQLRSHFKEASESINIYKFAAFINGNTPEIVNECIKAFSPKTLAELINTGKIDSIITLKSEDFTLGALAIILNDIDEGFLKKMILVLPTEKAKSILQGSKSGEIKECIEKMGQEKTLFYMMQLEATAFHDIISVQDGVLRNKVLDILLRVPTETMVAVVKASTSTGKFIAIVQQSLGDGLTTFFQKCSDPKYLEYIGLATPEEISKSVGERLQEICDYLDGRKQRGIGKWVGKGKLTVPQIVDIVRTQI